MNLNAPLCAPGLVYVRGKARSLVLMVTPAAAVIAPVRYRNVPLMRGDVAITGLAEIMAMGVPGDQWTVRTSQATTVDPFYAEAAGRCSSAMLANVMRALHQVARAASFEDRYRSSHASQHVPDTRGWKRTGH